MKPGETMGSIANILTNVKIDGSSVNGQAIDQERVEWYLNRFEMLVDDGCADAIASYFNKLLREDVNDITRSVILQKGLAMQLNAKENQE